MVVSVVGHKAIQGEDVGLYGHTLHEQHPPKNLFRIAHWLLLKL